MHRALLEARSAARAPGEVELVSIAGAELDARSLRTGAEASFALEAVPAGQAPARLVGRLTGREPADHLAERLHSRLDRKLGLQAASGIAEIPEVEQVERSGIMLRSGGRDHTAQICVDVRRGFLAVPDAHRHGALAGHHVTAGEE